MMEGHVWIPGDGEFNWDSYETRPDETTDRWEEIQSLNVCCTVSCVPDIDAIRWKTLSNEETGHTVHIAYWRCATSEKFVVWEWNA